MKRSPLSPSQIRALAAAEAVGCLSLSRGHQPPHAIPLHFVLAGDSLFFHCGPAGEKVRLAREGAEASFTLWRMEGVVPHPEGLPCRTNTVYRSALFTGRLELVEDPETRRRALEAIAAKYTPQLAGVPLPGQAVAATTVLRLAIRSMDGVANLPEEP